MGVQGLRFVSLGVAPTCPIAMKLYHPLLPAHHANGNQMQCGATSSHLVAWVCLG